jgi:hypothetical protein
MNAKGRESEKPSNLRSVRIDLWSAGVFSLVALARSDAFARSHGGVARNAERTPHSRLLCRRAQNRSGLLFAFIRVHSRLKYPEP